LFCIALPSIVALSLTLSGCGQLSLNQLLENEEPGDFRSTPAEANVPSGSVVTIEGNGGFKPYSFRVVSGNGILNPSTGEYVASGGVETAQIEARDSFDQSDVSTIFVYAPLSLKINGKAISSITINTAQTVVFDAEGGSISVGYDYYVDEVWAATSSSNGIWTFDPPSVGTYLVEVQDELGNSAVATVQVIRADLQISPTSTDVYQGGTVSFKGLNVLGAPVYSASPDVGSFAKTGDDAVYTAPPAPFSGTVTVTLSDDEDSATAVVQVLVDDPGVLAITPANTDVYQGGTVSFKGLNVNGTAVYTASPDVGSFSQTGDDAVYTAPSAPYTGTVTVTLSDDAESVSATVNVMGMDPGELAIDPAAIAVAPGDPVSFTGLNVFGTALYTASPDVGSFAQTGDDAVYTAPPAPFSGTVTVSLSDDSESVSASVYVSDTAPGALVLSPSSFDEDLGYGDVVVFTASGGVMPYSFWLEYEGAHGTLERINGTQARYTAPSANTVDWMWVEDALGATNRVKVKVQQ
jgi:phosphopantetheinyl transferase (holo-ACP synthase)